MFQQPFEQVLNESKNVLIAGMGGGFDFYHGLPLYFSLIEMGKTVCLSNFSFSVLVGEAVTEHMVRVDSAEYPLHDSYQPEWHLHNWFIQQNLTPPVIYGLRKAGVLPLLDSYKRLIARHEIDTIVWVDGGTDSLMAGDEDGLGTPGEDAVSLAIGSLIEVERQLLFTVGFGVEHYHGASNDLTYAAMSALRQQGGLLGVLPLLSAESHVEKYRAAFAHANAMMPNHTSIVGSSIIDSIDGHYGNYHSNPRTDGSTLWINPVMSLYWIFDLKTVARRNQLVPHLYMTEFIDQVVREIMIHQRLRVPEKRQRSPIPS